MGRIIVLATALLLLLLPTAGCRNRPTQLDPFLGRTTVPPPPTGSVSASGNVPPLTAPPSGSVYTPPGGFTPAISNIGSGSQTPARFTGTGSTPSTSGSSAQPIRVVQPPPGSNTTTGAPTVGRSGVYTGAASGGVDIMDLPVSNRSTQPKTAEQGRAVQQSYVSGGTTAGLDMSQARTSVLPGQEPAFGFDAAYSQLNGRLEYSPADGRWMLRYINPGQQPDRLGGLVMLSPSSPVSGFRNGDMVTLRGRMENDGGGQALPLYGAASVTPQREQRR